ncbi:transposase [Segatella copri]|uniref:transposase n=1 Tax=Segatella copri TaxID=165179 RepID=UPI0015F48631|nr:transposase [Segatella copri]
MAKGRDKELVNTRNIRIYERYYFWTEVKRLRFDDALKRLSTEEFFLSESRIMQIIRDMIQAGVTVDGKRIEKPLFTGFKLKPRSTSSSLKSSPYVEGQLFACP